MNGIELERFAEKKPCRAFIFTGGKAFCAEKMTDIPKDCDLVIAADSGCETLQQFSEKVKKLSPDIILGDMDSYKNFSMSDYPDAVFLPFPPEKDDTDTGLAVDVAKSFGCSEIIIAGGLGGRLDHTLANVFLLEDIRNSGARGIITDGKNRAYLAEKENFFSASGRKYLSIIPLDDIIEGVTMDGFKYPYSAATMHRNRFVTISNEVQRDGAKVTVERGSALIVESGD